MGKVKEKAPIIVFTMVTLMMLAGCSPYPATPTAVERPGVTTPSQPAAPETKPPAPPLTGTAAPDDIAVLVNKRLKLPDGYRPADVVEPDVPFIFAEHVDKRLMRKEAAGALERMFAAAAHDGIHLAGVSGYRSYETQRALFDYYVRVQGEDVARKYSAEPGHSEHQTGLAMDITGSTGQCATDDCFADTPEAGWLAAHAPEYGFIIRYPKGKEKVTGYTYEPWHVRYVGIPMAKEIAATGMTLEEYLGAAE